MKRKKTLKNKKALSMFAASAILATSLLPGERMVDAEEEAVTVIQPAEGDVVQKENLPVEKSTDAIEQPEQESHRGLIGYYFKDENFEDLSAIRESKSGNLVGKFKEDIKSVYWQGDIHVDTEGTYSFQTTDNQNVIITVNGERLLDQSNTNNKIQLEKGKKYKITIQYVRKENQEAFQLYWTKHLPDSDDTEFSEQSVPSHLLTLPNNTVENPTSDVITGVSSVTSTNVGKDNSDMKPKDTDGDGIPDEWEVNGYTVVWEESDGVKNPTIVRWSDELYQGKNNLFGKPYVKYVSDPHHKSTTRDPYSDYEKVMNKVDSSVLDIAKHPLVAALPALQIEVEDFSVGVADNITSTNDSKNINLKSIANQSGNTTTKGWSIGGSIGGEVDKKGPKASISLNGGYSSSTTTVNTMETVDLKQDEKGWSKSIGYNAGAKAYAYGSVRYKNVGPAPAYHTKPTVSMGLPISEEFPEYSRIHDMVATLSSEVNQGHRAINLPPHGTYPARDKFPVFFSNFSNYRAGSIELLESQFNRFEKQKQLQFDLVQWGADVTLGTTKPSEGNDWNYYISQSEPVTARLLYEMPTNQTAQGNQPVQKNPSVEVLERRIIGKPKNPQNGPNRPSVNLEEAIKLTSDLQTTTDGYKYGNYRFKDVTIVFDTASSPSIEQKISSGSLNSFSDVLVEEGMQIKIVPKGWVESNDVTYYYDEKGKLITGIHEIQNPLTGVLNTYCFDKDGKLVKENWILLEGKRYFTNADGSLVTGIKDINGKRYYFGQSGDETGLKIGQMAKNKVFKSNGNMYYATSDGSFGQGFYEHGTTWYYYGKLGDGTGLEVGQMATGWQNIDGKRLYFGNQGDETGLLEGEMATDWQNIDGKSYYFGKQDDGSDLQKGEMAKYFCKINGKSYYFNDDGSVWKFNGWLNDTRQNGEPKTWYILQGSEVVSDFRIIDGKLYYFDPKNDNRIITKRYRIIGNETYKFHEDGVAEINWDKGLKTFDNKKVFFLGREGYGNDLPECQLATGWQQIFGHQYYFGHEGDGTNLIEGEMATGVQMINGISYEFEPNGVLKS
ncbi:binary toxin-like calcium binding domain-containing protein [Bacillus mycoides]|uniref:binary toxin-like calcium binding domain-containing protein n=1 Tax=Bacillus mycoides TaxID=1405 RepID=UPI0038305B2B